MGIFRRSNKTAYPPSCSGSVGGNVIVILSRLLNLSRQGKNLLTMVEKTNIIIDSKAM
jgi:hypothetical protein